MEDSTFLSICPPRRNGQIHRHIVACSSSYDPLYLCGVSCNFFFISNFIDFEPSPFFLMSLAKSLYQFCLPFLKNQLFTDLVCCFLHLLFYFCSDLYDFFPSTNLGSFVLLFPVALGVRLCSLRFFLYPEVRLYCYKLLSYNCFCCVPWVSEHHVFVVTLSPCIF